MKFNFASRQQQHYKLRLQVDANHTVKVLDLKIKATQTFKRQWVMDDQIEKIYVPNNI